MLFGINLQVIEKNVYRIEKCIYFAFRNYIVSMLNRFILPCAHAAFSAYYDADRGNCAIRTGGINSHKNRFSLPETDASREVYGLSAAMSGDGKQIYILSILITGEDICTGTVATLYAAVS